MNKQHQSTIRLLSIASVTAGLLLSAAATPAVTPVRADTPESNPYADPTQCIYRAWDLAAQAGHRLPWFPGNAQDWREGAIASGYTVVDTISPNVVYSVAVWSGGVGGTSWAGHVGWVVQVEGDQFLVQDRNWIPASDYEHWVTWQPGISFIVFGQAAAGAATAAAVAERAAADQPERPPADALADPPPEAVQTAPPAAPEPTASLEATPTASSTTPQPEPQAIATDPPGSPEPSTASLSARVHAAPSSRSLDAAVALERAAAGAKLQAASPQVAPRSAPSAVLPARAANQQLGLPFGPAPMPGAPMYYPAARGDADQALWAGPLAIFRRLFYGYKPLPLTGQPIG